MRKYFSPFLSIAYCLLSIAIQAQQWHKLGTGMGYDSICGVTCFKQINGDLYIGGGFAAQWGAPANSIVRYNSTTEMWDSLGSGVGGEIYSIETYNGELYVGGLTGAVDWSNPPFYDKANTWGITKWNGTQWLSVDSVFSNNLKSQTGWPYALTYKNDLYIGGNFYNIPVSNGNAKEVVRYNGSVFDNMLGGIDGSFVFKMTIYKNELIVAGDLGQIGGVMYNYIARWDGIKWDSLGSGANSSIRSLEIDTVNDVLYAGGNFTMAGGVPVRYVAKWDGTQWSAVPNLPTKVLPLALKIFNGKLYAGIGWSTGGPADTVLMRLDSNGWVPIFGPIGGSVEALEVYNGNLYVGGCFDKVDTTVVNEIACYGDSCPGIVINMTLGIGINEINESKIKFKVYPNPAKREINVEVTGGKGQGTREQYIARLKNSLGQNIFEKKFEKKLVIDTSDFKNGIYLVEVCTADGKICHTEKVVIE